MGIYKSDNDDRYRTREEEAELRQLKKLARKRRSDITDSERARMFELMQKEDPIMRGVHTSDELSTIRRETEKAMAESDEPSSGIDELAEGRLRQIVTGITHRLHTAFSEQTEWYNTLQVIQKELPNFTSLQFFSGFVELALSQLMKAYPDLSDARNLAEFLSTQEGLGTLADEINRIIANPPVKKLTMMRLHMYKKPKST